MGDVLNANALKNSDAVLSNKAISSSSLSNTPNLQEEAKLCFAPSELFGEDIAKGFGIIAEPFISYKLTPFLERYGVAPFDLYQDYSFEGSIDKTYVGFLRIKNPSLSPSVINKLLTTPLKRPDILIDNSNLKEYYEIKPDSPSGRSAGRSKLANIESYYNNYSLPYKRGQLFNPPSNILIGRTEVSSGGTRIPVEVSFDLRLDNGLILYKLCIKTKWRLILALGLVYALLKAIIDLMRSMISGINEFADKIKNAIKENPLETLGIVTVAIIVIAFLIFGFPEVELAILAGSGSASSLAALIGSRLALAK
jgi:hypothetical protein